MSDDNVIYKPLGWLKADFKQKFGVPRQGAHAPNSRAQVELAPLWRGRGILAGLEGFSHIWLITHLHLSQTTRVRGKIHPPRLGGAKVGVLASRAPHRPNHIGLTLARVLECAGDDLVLSEVDLVDGTPILDLKPYLPAADRPQTFTTGWTDGVIVDRRACDFSAEAEAELKGLVDEPERVRELIREMITLDPRPPAYLGRADARFAVWVAGLNVVFRFHDGQFTVTKIERQTEKR